MVTRTRFTSREKIVSAHPFAKVPDVPAGGAAGFYETDQTTTIRQKYKTYQFYPGYNTMNFNANQR